jgi:glycerol kinase
MALAGKMDKKDCRVYTVMGDGGPTKNGYLMQLQSDILGSKVEISQTEELSACGIWDETIQSSIKRNSNERSMDPAAAQKKYSGWKKAVEAVCR